MQITRNKEIGTLVKRAIQKLALLLVENGASYLAAQDARSCLFGPSPVSIKYTQFISNPRGPGTLFTVLCELRIAKKSIQNIIHIYTLHIWAHAAMRKDIKDL